MPYFMTTYSYSTDTGTRIEHRPQHRQWLLSLGDSNVLSGPTDASTGILVLEVTDRAALDALLDQDPFLAAGVIESRRSDEWTPMTGRLVKRL